jgi:uncharacterized RDD family membrane protein YckC
MTDFTPAPTMRRVGALVHEAFFLVAFLFIATLIISKLLGIAPDKTSVVQTAVIQGFLFITVGIYFVYQWQAGRRTLAFKTWQLRLQSTTGEALSRQAAITRYLAAWIGPLLGLFLVQYLGKPALLLCGLNHIWAWFSPGKVTLHDTLARSRIAFEPNTKSI